MPASLQTSEHLCAVRARMVSMTMTPTPARLVHTAVLDTSLPCRLLPVWSALLGFTTTTKTRPHLVTARALDVLLVILRRAVRSAVPFAQSGLLIWMETRQRHVKPAALVHIQMKAAFPVQNVLQERLMKTPVLQRHV